MKMPNPGRAPGAGGSDDRQGVTANITRPTPPTISLLGDHEPHRRRRAAPERAPRRGTRRASAARLGDPARRCVGGGP